VNSLSFICRRHGLRADGFSSEEHASGAHPPDRVGWGIGTEFLILMAIAYHPWGRSLFGTAPLSWTVWLFILPFTVLMLMAEERRT
jgi:hypothetical protein